MIRVNSQYQNVQYLLENAMAKQAQSESSTSGQTGPEAAGVISKKINDNTLVEKIGNKITIYNIDNNNKKTPLQEIAANSEKGKAISEVFKLDAVETPLSLADSLAELQAARSSMSLVNYLA